MIRLIAVSAALSLVTAAGVQAGATGGTITEGDVSFTRTASSFDGTPEAHFTGVTTTAAADQLFEFGWWYRLAGESQETPFGTPATENYAGESSALGWLGLGGGTFSAVEDAVVHDLGVPGDTTDGGWILSHLTIFNISGAQLDLTIFHAADIDVNGTSSDSAALYQWDHWRAIRVDDPTTADYIYYVARDETASSFRVEPFASSVTNLLNDGLFTSFDQTGLPFGPGDFTGGWQFPLSIPAGGSATIHVYVQVNSFFNECDNPFGVFCDGFNSATPLAWSSIAP